MILKCEIKSLSQREAVKQQIKRFSISLFYKNISRNSKVYRIKKMA